MKSRVMKSLVELLKSHRADVVAEEGNVGSLAVAIMLCTLALLIAINMQAL